MSPTPASGSEVKSKVSECSLVKVSVRISGIIDEVDSRAGCFEKSTHRLVFVLS